MKVLKQQHLHVKYLEINLIKDIEDFYTQNDKVLMKEIKYLNKGIYHINSPQIKLNYIFCVIPIKVLAVCVCVCVCVCERERES